MKCLCAVYDTSLSHNGNSPISSLRADQCVDSNANCISDLTPLFNELWDKVENICIVVKTKNVKL
jgi:hypothetical protein